MRRAGSDGANSQFNVLLLQDVTFAEVFLQMYFPLIQSHRMAANTVARQIPLGRPKVTIVIILDVWQVSLTTKSFCLAGSAQL